MMPILEMPFVVKLLRILFIYFTKQRLNNYNDKHDTMISWPNNKIQTNHNVLLTI